ncbi:variably expressed lipoprotein and hemagglutinin (VlhA) family protein domain protein [Mycoplasmoides gallisepticum NC08_2008.031-4-3P]|nr:variably expressed lipoprotein and hemagglutinin (VlhA) family protein domain protein [Mycoplasmoides gallisepticum NC08_2008.031-4-3P]
MTLSNLKFGSNTIEFSVPTTAEEGTSKVAPMIGNMYLTSSDSDANKNKIYDDLFGNKSVQGDNQTAVTVDLLKGYSLATNYSIFVRRFMGLQENSMTRTEPIYLVGFIGGNQGRISQAKRSNFQNFNNSPTQNNNNRTFTIYVNAPTQGEYYISGSYLSQPSRSLMLSNNTSTNQNNSLTISNLMQSNWNTLGHFNTQMTTEITTTSDNTQMKRTLTLNQGLNKIVVSGVNNGDTPFIGNLTFTLSTTPQTAATPSSTSPQSQTQ